MVNREQIAAICRGVARPVVDWCNAKLTEMRKSIAELDERVKAIPAGAPGKNGRDGVDGKDGRDGKDGVPGIAGKDGTNGKDGLDGKPGESIKGEQGVPGKDAESIHPDTLALMVENRVRIAVDAIPKARDGRDGTNGRDAFDIEILPAIPEKPVPRGTLACHANGIWRAMRNTSPGDSITSAWEVVVGGITAIRMVQGDDLRSCSVECVLTGGTSSFLRMSLPVLIYREIFQEGHEYACGDVVTFGGSAWHCQAESTKAKPGYGAEWKLMVKEGRAAKEVTADVLRPVVAAEVAKAIAALPKALKATP